MQNRSPLHRHQPETTEIELIRGLFLALPPAIIMSIGFIVAGIVIQVRNGDGPLLAILIAGALASVARLFVAWKLAPAAAQPRLTLKRARQLELRFAIPYLSFALTLGLFGLRTFMLMDASAHVLVMCLIYGYCSGAAVGMGSRLHIAIPAMLLAAGPAALWSLLLQDVVYAVIGLFTFAVLSGGIHSLCVRHRHAVKDIELRLAFANLARKDALTKLPNRVALREYYDERVAFGPGTGRIALHYIDLNGFKPVNDSYGHPVGDALLIVVGKRIVRTIRDTDIVARLGGDEFVVIQYGIEDADEATRLAKRLSAVIARPFRIEQHTIKISTALGYVIADSRDEDLEHLMGLADQALYVSKRSGGTIMQYDAIATAQQRNVA